MIRRPPRSTRTDTLFPYTTLFRSQAAGFDASEFEDPHQFDIRRKPKGTLVFGTGIHHCVGQRLARYVLKTAITAMITRFPALKLADPEFQPVYRGFTGELQRSEERRVGKECVSTCRSRWSPYH